MGKRRWRLRSGWFERGAFVLLLGVVAALVLASTRLGTESTGPPKELATEQVRLSSGALTAVVGDSAVIPATSESGRRRDRVRVVIAVALAASGDREVSPRRALRLEYSGRVIRPDLAADGERVLDLRAPVEPGTSRSGEVRFELAGSDTDVLRNRGDARLILVAPSGRRDSTTIQLDVPA